MKILKIMLGINIIIAIGWSFITWTSWHDKQIAIAADKYEKCVLEEYGVMPYTWYAEHGEYPTCPTTK